MDERIHRFFACELVQEAGILLSLPQVVLATAQSLLHRFYNAQSLMDFDAFRVAMGTLFVAAKAEEQPRRIRDVIQVFFRMRNRRMGLNTSLLLPSDERFTQWTDWIIMVERQVLIEVGFSIDAMTEHPHKFLLYYVKILDGSKELAQKAWNYVNDSFRIDLCLRYDAHVIACAAVDLAARVLKIALPQKWQVLLEVDANEMEMVAREMLSIYEIDKVQWISPLTSVNPYVMVRGEYLGASEEDIPECIKQETSTAQETPCTPNDQEKQAAPSPSIEQDENGSSHEPLEKVESHNDKSTGSPPRTPQRTPSPRRESRRRHHSRSRSRESRRQRSPRRRRSSSRSSRRSSDRSSRHRHRSRSRSRNRRRR